MVTMQKVEPLVVVVIQPVAMAEVVAGVLPEMAKIMVPPIKQVENHFLMVR